MKIWCACETQDLEGLKFRFFWCYCPCLATFLSSETHLVITVSNLSNMCCLFHLLHKVCSEIHLIITDSNLLNLCYLFQLRCYSNVARTGLDSDDPLPKGTVLLPLFLGLYPASAAALLSRLAGLCFPFIPCLAWFLPVLTPSFLRTCESFWYHDISDLCCFTWNTK